MYIKFEVKTKLLKTIIKTKHILNLFKYLALYKRSNIPRSSTISRIVNRCLYTGRKYSTIKHFQLSRFSIRFNTNDGYLPGVRRHS